MRDLPASVNNGMVGHAGALEFGTEQFGVQLLVLGLVPLGVGGIRELARCLVPGALLATFEWQDQCFLVSSPSVPPGNVGGDTTNLARGAGGLVDLGKPLGARLEVVVPAQPATVAGVDVHNDIVQVELLQCVRNTLFVPGLGVLASLQIAVGYQVGQGVGLDDKSKGLIGVLLEDPRDDCYIALAMTTRLARTTDVPSMYSVLYLSSSPTASSPLEALAAQSRPGRS